MVDRGDNTYGGKYVVNPSGGLISKGHPLGATGLAQCAELCWQLRGLAGKRQQQYKNDSRAHARTIVNALNPVKPVGISRVRRCAVASPRGRLAPVHYTQGNRNEDQEVGR